LNDILRNRLVFARDTAIQSVVFDALVMRLMWFQPDSIIPGAQGCIPTAAVAAAVRHVLVQRHIIPAGFKLRPISQGISRPRFQPLSHTICRRKAKTCLFYTGAQVRWVL